MFWSDHKLKGVFGLFLLGSSSGRQEAGGDLLKTCEMPLFNRHQPLEQLLDRHGALSISFIIVLAGEVILRNEQDVFKEPDVSGDRAFV